MRRDASKEKCWREALSELGGSGQSVQEFCRQRGLKAGLLYAWRRELRTRDAEAAGNAGFVELVGPADAGMAQAGVSVRIDDRVHIVLGRGFDQETLKTAVNCLLAVTTCAATPCGGPSRGTSAVARKAEAAGS